MKVVALRAFQDLKANILREAGSVFEASQERLDEINATSHGVLAAQVILPDKKDETKKTTAAPKKGKK